MSIGDVVLEIALAFLVVMGLFGLMIWLFTALDKLAGRR